MDIEKIASFLQNLSPVTIRAQLCSRTITPKSSCSNCQKVCPVQAITLTGNGPKVEPCISCGLCIEACPNHVFKLNENNLLDINNKQIQTLILTCSLMLQNSEKTVQNSISKISCLGELYPELLIYLLSIFSKIIIIHDPKECSNCFAQTLEEKFQLDKFSNILDENITEKLMIVNDINKIKPYLNTQKTQPAHDRRSFFKSIFTGSKELSQQILDSALHQEIPKNKKEKPLKMYYLSEALKKQKNIDYSKMLPYPKIKLTACNFCGACSKLCPTGALKINEEEKEKRITFTPNLCTHCNICSDVCFYQGLSWENDTTLGEFINDEAQILGSAIEKVCDNCQQEYYDFDENQNLCFLCRPMHNQKFF